MNKKQRTKIRYILLSILSLFLIFIVSCGEYDTDFLYQDIQTQNTEISSTLPDVPQQFVNASDFLSAISKLGVRLSNQDTKMLTTLCRVIPSGEWTPGPENNSKANMIKHFEKHSEDFNPAIKNVQEYLNLAVMASKSKSPESKYFLDIKPYMDEKIVSVVKWNYKTGDFTVTRENGQIATYFFYKKLNKNRYFLIPDEMR